jgi:hypothetical protein
MVTQGSRILEVVRDPDSSCVREQDLNGDEDFEHRRKLVC